MSDKRTYSQLIEQKKDAFLKKAARDLLIILQKHFVSKEDDKFLKIFLDNFDIPKFYIIWKIHKNPIVGRPIVASCRWLTTAASIFVGEYLKEFIKEFDTILEDTSSIIKILETQTFPENCILFTLDADSLYTNIPTEGYNSALMAIRRLFTMFPINTGDAKKRPGIAK